MDPPFIKPCWYPVPTDPNANLTGALVMESTDFRVSRWISWALCSVLGFLDRKGLL